MSRASTSSTAFRSWRGSSGGRSVAASASRPSASTRTRPRRSGDWVVEEHTEGSLRHEELYLVLRGRATFTLGDETIEAPAGTLVFISDPEVKRKAVAEEVGTTVLAVGGKPGEAFTPSPWEWFFQAYQQPPDQGIETMRAGIEELGERAPLYYHLACMEAKAGRLEDAKEHLAHAIELDLKFEEIAASDDDLKEVR